MDLHRTARRQGQLCPWWRRRRSERGASLVEYALLIALIAVVLIGAVTFLGEAADDSLRGSSSSIVDATT